MTPANQSAFPSSGPIKVESGLTKREYFAAMAMQGLLAHQDSNYMIGGPGLSGEIAFSAVAHADAMLVKLNLVQVVATPEPTPPTDSQPWPLPPNLRMPRLVADVGQFVRSTGTDEKGNYYEDFYDDRPVFRDNQGYFQIDDGATHVSYLNLPGASIEHRIVPRPSSGATMENA